VTAGTWYTTNFGKAVLKLLGAPTSPGNLKAFAAWAQIEGDGGTWNPLNTTQTMPGSTPLSGNPDGVQNYTSATQGVQATYKTLMNGDYSGILAAMRANQGAAAVANAIEASPWDGSGHYGGEGGSLSAIVSGGPSPVPTGTPLAVSAPSGVGSGTSSSSSSSTAASTPASTSGIFGSGISGTVGKILLTGLGVLAGGGLIVFGVISGTGADKKAEQAAAAPLAAL
jgi:hypothetical protein